MPKTITVTADLTAVANGDFEGKPMRQQVNVTAAVTFTQPRVQTGCPGPLTLVSAELAPTRSSGSKD